MAAHFLDADVRLLDQYAQRAREHWAMLTNFSAGFEGSICGAKNPSRHVAFG
jgi:hypothetical protein